LLSEHAPDLANLEIPLRQLLVTVRYWDGEKAAEIQRELVRDIRNPPERTVIFNGLTQRLITACTMVIALARVEIYGLVTTRL
jgi:hypothetical protein